MSDEGGNSTGARTKASEVDSFLEGVAQAPSMTLPSPQAGAAHDLPDKLSHFTVLGQLGRGGMGIVYRAKDEALGRVVALKVLPPEFEADGSRRNRFLREARAAAAVTHPNIVTVYEIGEDQGRVFIAMELVAGQPLREMLLEGPLSAQTALRLMLQIVAGVAKAHEAGIVHRDLKPENTLVTGERQVKVLDFGLAKHPAGDGILVTGTGEGMVLGTPAYMAPEQMHGMPVTPASDVFALGVMLYELLTGQRPFTGKNLPQIVRSIERDVPRAPSSVNPLVPVALDGIVARCLSKDPSGRYPDAGALHEKLRQLEAAAARTSLASTVEQPVANSFATPPPSSTVAGRLPTRTSIRSRRVVLAAAAMGVFAAVLGQRIYVARRAAAQRPLPLDIPIVAALPPSTDSAEPKPWAPPLDGELHVWSSARDRGHAHWDLPRYCRPFLDNAPHKVDREKYVEGWLAESTDGLPPAQVAFCRSPKVVAFVRDSVAAMGTLTQGKNGLTQIGEAISAAATRRLARGEAPFCPSSGPVPRVGNMPDMQYQPRVSEWTEDPGWGCLEFSMEGPLPFQYWFETTATTFTASARRFYLMSAPGLPTLWRVTMTTTGYVKDGQVFATPEIDEKWEKVN